MDMDVRMPMRKRGAGGSSSGWLWNVLIPVVVIGTGLVMYNLSGGEEELSMTKQEEEAMLAARSTAATALELKGRATGGGGGILLDEGGEGGGGGEEEEEDARSFYENLEKRLDQQTKDLEKAVAEAITMLASQEQPQWAKDLLQATSSLADEVKSIKSQLASTSSRIDHDESSSGGGGNGGGGEESSRENMVTEPGNDEVVKAPLPTLEERLVELRSALAELVAKNSVEQLRPGCSTLIMYVSKLIEQPDVPRYRRVSVTNQTFKTLVLPLHEHERVLAAVGFVKRGAYFEWNWAPSAKPAEETKEIAAEPDADAASKVANAVEDMSMEILKKCVELLEPNVSPLSSNKSTAPASSDVSVGETSSVGEETARQEHN